MGLRQALIREALVPPLAERVQDDHGLYWWMEVESFR